MNTAYKKIALTGGGAGSLDGIDGSVLVDGDYAIVTASNIVYEYILNATSGVAESSPDIISPDISADDKRWILQKSHLSSLATAENDFLVASGAGTFIKKTLAQTKTILGWLLTSTAEAVGFTISGGTTSKTLTVLDTMTLALGTATKVPKASATGYTDTAITVSANNEVTNASQPAFLAYNSATDTDVTGDGTNVTVDFDTEVFDQGNDFSGDTFTAPVTGKYQLQANIYLSGLAAGDTITLQIVTSNRSYVSTVGYNTYNYVVSYSVLADMDVGDTASVTLAVAGGTKDVDIYGAATPHTNFSGFLIC